MSQNTPTSRPPVRITPGHYPAGLRMRVDDAEVLQVIHGTAAQSMPAPKVVNLALDLNEARAQLRSRELLYRTLCAVKNIQVSPETGHVWLTLDDGRVITGRTLVLAIDDAAALGRLR